MVGAGLAGFSAATQLRRLGFEGAITLIDAEPAPYDRPPLSKILFEKDFSLERLAFASTDELATQRIDSRFGVAVQSFDAGTRVVTLDNGDQLQADVILLTTGGRARKLAIPGADLAGVSVLRTMSDALELREAVQPGTRVAVVGAGLIGAELASSLTDAGAEVTLIDPAETPLVPAVGDIVARHLHAMHEPRGVRVVTGMTTSFVATEAGLEVHLADGVEISADRIVVGVGLVPNVEIAAQAGLETDNGIIVDEGYLTSTEGIFAAGDVARTRAAHGELLRREEHWEAAQVSGQHAAYAILGLPLPERGASWFWSDRHNCHLEATGRMHGSGEFVIRGGGPHPAVFLVEDGLLKGAAAIDDNMLVRASRRLIDQQIPVAADELADPDVSLRSLLKAKR